MKNKYTSKLFFVLCVISLISCTQKETNPQNNSNQFFTIDFAEIIKNKNEVPLSEIAKSIEFIQFETTTKSLLGNIMDIKLTKDYIFIHHNGDKRLTQFSRQGKFIRHIGIVGRGPKEYALMRTFSLDEKNELIYIQTNWTRKFLVYNFKGEYVKTLRFNAVERGMVVWSRDNLLMSFSEPLVGNEPYVFIEHNEKGDTLQYVKNYIFWDESEISDFSRSYWGRNAFYRFDNKLHMKGWYNDTVYTYNDQSIIAPKYFIDLKDHKIPNELVFERQSTKPLPQNCYWIGVNETSNYIFIRYAPHYSRNFDAHSYFNGCVFYNKTTKEGIALIEREKVGFINDISAGPNFNPLYTNDTITFVDVTAMDMKLYLDSEEFKNSQPEFPEQKEKLIQLNQTLKEDDNHFLMVAKLK